MQIYLFNVLQYFILATSCLTFGPSQKHSVFQEYEGAKEDTIEWNKKKSNLSSKKTNDVPMYV